MNLKCMEIGDWTNRKTFEIRKLSMEEKKQKDLLIIMPAYNEEKNIVPV